MAEGAFIAVFHEDLQANFPAVWDDDKMLAAFIRLLVVADKFWPSPGELPRAVRVKELTKLSALGLVMRMPQHRFRMPPLDARRERQRSAAQTGAHARWNAPRNAGRNATGMPTRPDQTNTRPDRGASIAALHEAAMAAVDRGEYVTYALALEAMKAKA